MAKALGSGVPIGGGQGTAVEALEHADDHITLGVAVVYGVLTSQLDLSLVGLGAGVGEEHISMLQNFKSNAEAIAAADKYLYGNHARMPIVMDKGEGCYVWDLDGRKFLDFVGGIAVNGLGRR